MKNSQYQKKSGPSHEELINLLCKRTYRKEQRAGGREVFLSILIVVLLISGSSFGYSLDLSVFLKEYIQQNEEIMNQEAVLQAADANKEIAQDQWATTFQVSPSQSLTTQKFNPKSGGLGTSVDAKRTLLSGKLTQGLAGGISASLEGFRTIDDDSEQFVGTETEWQGALTIDLWQNAFGAQERAQKKAASLKYQAESLKFEKLKRDACHSGIQLYYKTYFELERFKINEQKLTSAQSALKIAKRSYRQRLIRSIDLYSAEAEYLNSEAQFGDQQSRSEITLKNIKLESGALSQSALEKKTISEIQLNHPAISLVLPGLLQTQPDWSILSKTKIQNLLRDSASWMSQSAKYQNRSKVQAGVSLSQADRVTYINSGLADQKDETLSFYLSLEWPWDKTQPANIQKALADEKIAEAEKYRVTKIAKLEFHSTQEQMKTLKKEIALSLKRSVLFAKRMNRGLQLVRTGKIDYEEYISYSTAFFNEKLSEIQFKQNLMQSELNYLSLLDETAHQCQSL